MKKTLLFLAFCPLFMLSQVPNLLKDINTGNSSTKFGQFATLANNNIVFGVVTPSSTTSGIWTSDGSTAGTKQLKAVPGPYTVLIDYNGKKYFTSTTPGTILWRTDGTVAGTDSIPIAGLTAANNFTVHNNLLYFIGTTAAEGTELWRSDGTIGGTFMVKDIWPAGGNGVTQILFGFSTYCNGSVFFIANDGVAGQELWKTDGTTAGTSLVKDINPGTASSGPGILSTATNGLYFMANNQVNGAELWFTDGTTANTQLIRDVATGTASAYPGNIVLVGTSAYYSYGKVLYKTNGTSAGTTTLNLVTTTPTSLTLMGIVGSLYEYNNDLYYLTREAYNVPLSPSPMRDTLVFWKVDLNLTAKTKLLQAGFNIGGLYGSYGSIPRSTRQGSSFIYFVTSFPSSSDHVFIFNPQSNRVKIYYGKVDNLFGSPVKQYQTFGNKLYFPYYKNNDSEPSYLDLTNDSIYLIKDINTSGTCFFETGSSYGNWNHQIFTLNNKRYLLARSAGYGVEFWETDFTGAGTVMVKDINPGSNDYNFVNFSQTPTDGVITGAVTSNNIFFAANDGATGLELWSFINSPNTTSIAQQKDEESGVSIFPNPGSDKVVIQSKSAINHIQIHNSVGALVMDEALNQSREINVSVAGLKTGLYFVTLKTSSGDVTKKLLKD